nr:PREDICTED: prostatic acid phosphatase-like [Bemisia tabaci]
MFSHNQFFYVVATLTSLIQPYSCKSTRDDPNEVVFVNVIFRHGDRSPIETYKNDPYSNASYWPMGWGQLTNKGKMQHYEFGRWMRDRYSKLLPEQYHRSDIYVQSTDVDRTLMSVESHLAGLYPPVSSQIWNQNLSWQPIPIHTVPESMDYILSQKKPCERYDYELKKAKSSSIMKAVNEKYKQLYQYVTLHSGKKIDGVLGILDVYDVLFIESLYGFGLPDWTAAVFPEPMKTVSSIAFMLPSLSQEMRRLKAGPLIGQITKHLEKKSRGKLTPDRKLWIYSAHDTTVAAVLMALNLYNSAPPPYTAAIIFELRKNSANEHFVSLYYRNTTDQPPYELVLPGCLFYCPLDQFILLTKPVVPDDWQSECESSYNISSLVMHNIYIVATLVFLMSLATIITLFQWRKNYMVHRTYRKLSLGIL